MKRHLIRILFLIILTLGLLTARPGSPAEEQPAPQTGAPLSVMPPHPGLENKIRQGLANLPQVEAEGSAHLRSSGEPQTAAIPGAESALNGQVNALAVLVRFSDKNSQVSASFFDRLVFNPPVAGRGSVRDYYHEVSSGQLDIVTLNLPSSLGWQTAPASYGTYVGNSYCTDGAYPRNCQKLAEDVATLINGLVDFSKYDNDGDGVAEPILIIHAGPGAELTGSPTDMWSHSWSLRYPRSLDGVAVRDYILMPEYWLVPGDMTIGVFAHEMAHGFWDLPDLYDLDYTSQGLGSWSLMAGGSWNGPLGLGGSPAWPDAWTRMKMGFAVPADLAVSGTYSLVEAAAGTTAAQPYRIQPVGLPGTEYFLLENRVQTPGSYDEYLPGSGMLIWHIDEAMSGYGRQNLAECTIFPKSMCNQDQHYLVALEQADGLLDLEKNANRGDDGDPFPGSSARQAFSMNTNPGSHSYYGSQDPGFAISAIRSSGPAVSFDLLTAPGGFRRSSPADAASVPVGTVMLDWQDSPGAEAYEYCLRPAAQAACSNWVRSAGSQVQVSDLTAGTLYAWQVRAFNKFGTAYADGSASKFWTFKLDPASPPGGFLRLAPADGAQGLSAAVLLDWQDSPGALEYAYCIGQPGLPCATWISTGAASQAQLSGLPPGTSYAWQVRASNASGTTYSLPGEQAAWTFTTQPEPANLPAAFGMLTPPDGAQNQPLSVTLHWQPSAQVSGYQICFQVDDGTGCQNWIAIGSDPELTVSGLAARTRYAWQVRAVNPSGTTYANGAPAALWTFTTGGEGQDLLLHPIYLPLQLR